MKWQWKALTSVGTLGFVLWLFWLGWTHLGPRKPEVGPMRRQVAIQIMPRIVEDIREARQDVRTAALLHFVNDPSDYVTDRLRAGIEQSGIVDLRNRTFIEKVRNVLNLRHPSFGSMAEAVEFAEPLGVQAAIFGTVNQFESGPDGAKIDLDLTVAKVAGAQPLLTKRYEHQVSTFLNAAAVQEQVRSVGTAQRFLAWVLLVLLLPVFSIGFIRAMVRKESNRVNAFTLTVYTIVDAILAWLLVGAALSSWGPILIFIICVGAAFAYNFYVMNFAWKLEEA